MQKLSNYIDGKLVAPKSKKYIDLFNPAKGSVYAQVPNSSMKDVDIALKAASKAFPNWANTSINRRAKILNKIADLIMANLDRLAKAESKDNGKPVSLAKAVDIPRSAANFRFFAHAITQFSSESH